MSLQHCDVYGKSACIVGPVRMCSGIQQNLDSGRENLPRIKIEQPEQVARRVRELTSGIQEGPQHGIVVPHLHCDVQRRPAFIVGPVRMCSGIQQNLDSGRENLPRIKIEQPEQVARRVRELTSGIQEGPQHGIVVPHLYCDVQRHPAFIVGPVRMCSGIQQNLDSGRENLPRIKVEQGM